MTATLTAPRQAVDHHRAGPLVGTRHLVRLALRRDRIILPLWVLLIGVIPAAGAGTYEALYPSTAERQALTGAMSANPSFTLLYGPAFDLSTVGGWTVWRYGVFLPLFLALACIFSMTRHTRQEEDTGRQELLSSAVLGRRAGLTASLLVCLGGSAAVGVLIAASMIGVDAPVGGSLAFAAAVTLSGWVFTGVAAVAAQFAEYARTANGIACGVLGGAFMLRAVGDALPEADFLSWLSPIGWSTRVRPYADEQWWVLLLLLAAALVLVAGSYVLLDRRDVGMGLRPARLGPPTASEGLRSPLALAWRLHRGVLIGWSIGFALTGALFGSMADGIGDVVGSNEQMREAVAAMGGSSGIVDAFLGVIMSMFGIVAALYAVQATLRLRSEETAIRLEPVLATRVSRLRLAASHLVFALLGPALVLLLAGLGVGLLHGVRTGDLGGVLPTMLEAAAVQLPAVWVVAAVAVLLVGLLPRFATLAWGVVAAFLLITMLGPVVQASQLVLNVSPFQHVPRLPGAEFTAEPLLWLTAVAVVGLAVGLAGFRRRDIG